MCDIKANVYWLLINQHFLKRLPRSFLGINSALQTSACQIWEATFYFIAKDRFDFLGASNHVLMVWE
jgi:hypothetical protein